MAVAVAIQKQPHTDSTHRQTQFCTSTFVHLCSDSGMHGEYVCVLFAVIASDDATARKTEMNRTQRNDVP